MAPVGEAQRVAAGLHALLHQGEPVGHPETPAARVPVVAAEIFVVAGVLGAARGDVFGGRGLVGAVAARHAAAAVGRVGDEGVELDGWESLQYLNAVAAVERGVADDLFFKHVWPWRRAGSSHWQQGPRPR